MVSIVLKDLRFRANHGVYAGEKLTGGDFIVQLEVHYNTPEAVLYKLEDTLNYELLFSLVKAKMMVPVPLIETIAMEITTEIMRDWPAVERVLVCIEKCNPPIEGFSGSVAVKHQRHRS